MNKFTTKKRTEIGSNQVNKLRAEGFVPAVAYGSHSKTYEISVPKSEFERFLSYNQIGSKVKIKVGRSYEDAVLKDVQRDPLTRQVLHADFQLLKAGEAIKLKIPVHILGRESVEDKRTIVQDMIHELEIVALPKDLIDHIDVDVTGKVVGDAMTVADIAELLPEGVELAEEADKIVVVVAGKSIAEESEEEETTESEMASEPLEVL